MAIMTMSEVRKNPMAAIDTALTEAVFVEDAGKRAAVVISVDAYEELMEAFEDVADLTAYRDASRAEGSFVGWEQARAELGW